MSKNILITGAAKRIGAECATLLHQQGNNIVLHYRHSKKAGLALSEKLNQQRPNSAVLLQADLLNLNDLKRLANKACEVWGDVDVLINNASSFYPQAVNEVLEENWDELIGSNLKAPFFLAQALENALSKRQGCIINIVDIHAERGLKNYPVYSIAKAGLAAMTKVLAKEFAPSIRVNAVSPGAILWPEESLSASAKDEILEKIALKRAGEPRDIAKAVSFLINDADYMTGQMITIDGGRTLFC